MSMFVGVYAVDENSECVVKTVAKCCSVIEADDKRLWFRMML